jgi:hypothetical protein
LNVKVDGLRTYFEWLNAGHYTCGRARGTMTRQHSGRLTDLYFGFDTQRLLLRFDTGDSPARQRLADVATLRVTFVEPEGFELLVSHPGWQEPILQLYHHDVPVGESGVTAAANRIVEVAIPFRSLAVSTDDPVDFYVELLEGDNSVERAPHEGVIETFVPSPDYELLMWQA